MATDDVRHQVWSRGILSFRAHGRDGGGAPGEGVAQEEDHRGKERWRLVKQVSDN